MRQYEFGTSMELGMEDDMPIPEGEAYARALEDALLLFIPSVDSARFADPTHGAVLKHAWIRATRRVFGAVPDVIECPLTRWFEERKQRFSTRLKNVLLYNFIPSDDAREARDYADNLRRFELPEHPTIVDFACVRRQRLLSGIDHMGEVTVRELESHMAEEGLSLGMTRDQALLAYRPKEY